MNQKDPAQKSSTGKPRPCIWAVGGGKGGVGKSVLTANLAVALARSGKKCIAVDADLGGGNLHTLFGVPNGGKSLADLLSQRASSLEEIQVPTSIPGLQLISGAKPLFAMANPHYQQKVKIIRQICTLDAEYVLIDLGAGSAFNVLDFFLPAHRQMVVVSPMPTAVENAYHFLKAAYFRHLKAAARGVGLLHQLEQILSNRKDLGIRSPRDIAPHLLAVHREKGELLMRRLNSFRPGIVMNQVRKSEEERLGEQIAKAARSYFAAEIEFLGYLHNDDHVYEAVQSRKPVLETFPQAAFSTAVRRICTQLVTG